MESVDAGVTGPKERREAANWGSEASSAIDSSRVSLALDWGCTVGPGVDGERAEAGGRRGVLVVADEACSGYLRLAADVAVLAALEEEEPIVECGHLLTVQC